MAVTVTQAKEADAAHIADIHLAAFETNEMLLVQFPTPAIRRALWTTLKEKAIAEIRDPKWVILVAVDEDQTIISFAKWCLPIREADNYEESSWQWPEGTNMAILNEWAEKVEAANARILGSTPCYRLSFIGTDPQHQGKGGASPLVKWGLDRCMNENVPAALEGTTNASRFYEKFGFRAEERISMQLDGVGQDGASVLYEEICLVFRPNAAG